MAPTDLQGAPDLSYRTSGLPDDVEKSSSVQKGDESVKVVTATRTDFSYHDTRKILRKVDMHLLPLLMLSYLLKNLDVNMISYVKTMNSGQPTNALTQLGMSTNDWAWNSTVYTITFMIFELPSNMILKWSTPRLHYFRIILFWSVATACQAAAKNAGGLLTARAFMGVFEAGLLPGIFVQMTMWYRPDELSSYGLAYIDGRGGLSGWQWAFVIEGILGVFICAAIYMFLPDYPDSPPSFRQFLTPEEGAFLVSRLPPNAARQSDETFSWKEFWAALKDPLTWGFGMMMLFEQTGTSGYSFWLPTIIAGFGFTTTERAQLLNIPPAIVYIVATASMAYVVDNTFRFPRPGYQIMSMLALIGFFVGLTVLDTTHKAGLYTLILLTSMPHAAFQAIIYPWRSQTVKGSTYVAVAFAVQNSVGQLASVFSAQIFRSQYAPRYRIPFIVCEIFLALTIGAVAFTWYHCRETERETRRIAAARHAAGKQTGEVLEEDVHVGRL
ncbi:MFS general substrate transporter [Stereum hirsutum FP-91666 SS1]|uniref:MFS general substrate transporter n=1 Tax=Stereum hirsutum (strain FP-91666) TaxID=721885 RepID=UPI0004449DCF|nr:MFS general substrate transporter [Stereum hirsutum FP-91666 SS1]EIM81962.1 MFS general substrate transporter [Stereum hirsutum FP-91666 SS1]